MASTIGPGRAGVKKTTLVYLIDKSTNAVLLAMKKRGFGEGLWNGPGGKADPEAGDTTIKETAIRETLEEVCVRPDADSLVQQGLISFHFVNDPSWDNDCSVFVGHEWEGEPAESDEMKPQWFSLEDPLPYDQMWPDDRIWMPRLFADPPQPVFYAFVFDNQTLLSQHVFDSQAELLDHISDVHPNPPQHADA